MRKRLLALALILLMTITVAFFLVQPEDPLAQFRTPDGGLSFSGGALTQDLLQLLFARPRSTIETTYWMVNAEGHPTASYTSHVFAAPNPNVYLPDSRGEAARWLAGVITDELGRMWQDVLNFWDMVNPVGIASAVVDFDAATESERIGTTDPHTWSHTPVGTPRGVIVTIGHGTESTDLVVSCSYGSASMTRILSAADTATEPGRVYAYFVGSGIPTGAQTVSCDLTSATTTDIHFVSMTFTSAAVNTEVIASDSDAENQANPTATLPFTGRTAMAAMVFYSGIADVSTATLNCSGSSGCSTVHFFDIAAFGSRTDRQTTAGSTDQVMGYTVASDDVAVVYLAISEVVTVQNRFAVFNDAQCTATTASTDADCWSTTSGGDGNGVPASGDSIFLDTGVSPFTATGTMDASLNIGSGAFYACSGAGAPNAACGGNFQGTFAIATFTLTNTGVWQMNDMTGTVSISTGTIDGGAATLLGAGDLSVTGAATLTWNSLTISGGTLAKGTAALNVDSGDLVMSGGDLTSTSGTVTITGIVNISSAASAIDFGSETWTITNATGNSWTNASTDATWDAGTGTVTFNAGASNTLTFAGANLAEAEFNNLTLNDTAAITYTMATRGLRWLSTLSVTDTATTVALATADLALGAAADTPDLNLGARGTLTANASTVILSTYTQTSATASTLTITTGAWTLSGNWDSSGSAAVFAQGTGIHTFDATATITLLSTDNTFDDLTITPGGGNTVTLSSALIVTNALTITTGTFAKGTNAFTSLGSLTMDGGDLTSTSGTVAITGAVNVSSAASAIDFGSETWTVSGAWTNASTDATWDAGTGSILFDSATGATVTFAGANLAEAEFNSVTFTSSAGTAQTFTMATRGLRWLTTLTVSDASSTTALATADLALGNSADTPDLSIGNGGILTANASTVIVSTVTMTGGTSGTITVTTGAWTVSGNWNTSGASSVYTQGTGIVTFDATATITLLSTDNTFDDLTISAGTVTLATNTIVTNELLISGGTFAKSTFTVSATTLTMSGGDLTSTSGSATVTGNVNISSAASAIAFGSEAWTVSGTWTNASTDAAGWAAGTATVTFDSVTGGTMTFAGANLAESEFNSVTFSSTGGTAQTFTMALRALRWGGTLSINDASSTTALATADFGLSTGALSVGNGGILTANASTAAFTSVTMTGGASGVITVTTGAWTVSGNWDTSGVGSTYTQGTGIVTFDATATITMLAADNTFDDLTISAGTATIATNLVITNALTLSGGTYAKGTTTLTAGSLTMSGGDLTSTSGAVVVTGAVNISSIASAIDFGSESWTISGTWTNASTDGTVWEAGTGTVTFDSATGGTMTFAGANLAEPEFFNVTFTSSAGTPQTFTMATRALRWSGTLTVSDASSTTALATADLGLSTGALSVGNGGILTANATTATLASVTMTGGTSGVITVTTGAWTVSGNWDTSGAGSTYTQGTGIVTFDATASITMLSTDNTFDDLTISAGTATINTNLVITNALTISGGTYAKGTTTLTAGSLTMSGGDLTSTSGAVVVTGNVNISATTSAIDLGSETWTVSGTWTNATTDAAGWDAGTGTVAFDSATGGTMTFAGANIAEAELNNATFNSTSGTAQTFTMATRSLRIAGTLTITDSTSTTTLDTATLNIQANIIDVLANGILLCGTGDLIGLVTLNVDGSMTMDTIVVANIFMNRTAGTGTIDVTLWTAFAVGANVDVRWTFSPSVAGDTWQFVLEDVTAATSYDLKRNAIVVDTQTSAGTVVTLSRAAGWAAGDAMAIDETPVGCGSARFWVGGTGSWSATARWSDSSGGAGGCDVPTSSNAVTIDAASCSAACTITVDVNAAMASFDDTGFNDASSTLAVGTLNFTVSGAITLAASQLLVTIGASAGTGFTATGALTMSGGAIECGAAACIGDIDGNVNVSATGSYIDFGSAAWNFGGTWTNSTTSISWDAGTSTVTFDAAVAGTMTFAGANLAEAEFNSVTFTSSAGTAQTFTMATRGLRWLTTLTVSDTVSTTALATADLALGAVADAADIVVGNGGILTANASTVLINGFTMTGGTSGTLTITTGAWTVSGSWNSSGASSVFTQGTGIHTFDATATITLLSTDNTFDDLTITPGGGNTVTLSSALIVTNALTITTGTFAKGTNAFTSLGSLTMDGGDLTSTSGAVTVTGAVNISSTLSAIDFGSETWTVSGAWTNASTDSVWDAGTGSILFDSATGATLTFAGTNLAEAEFNSVTFTSSAGTSQTFTMATRGLRWLTTLSIVDGTSTTALATTDLALGAAADTPDLSVGNGGILTANASTVLVSTVTMTGGTSGVITVTTGAWTVSGSWNTSGAGSTYTQGTGIVTFDATATITLLSTDNTFDDLTISAGTSTMASAVVVTNTLTVTGTLATADLALTTGPISISNAGVLTANASTVIATSITMTGGVSGTITVTTGAWTVSGNWNTSGVGSVYTQGTGIVTFDATATITLLSTDNTFDDLTISVGTSTMASAVIVTNTLTVTGTLATANLALTTGPMSISNAGVLTANASTVVATSVTMTGGVSGTITVTTGAWTVSGNWNTSGAGSVYTQGTGIVTFDATTTITMLATDNTFDDLTVSAGTATIATNLVITNALTISGGTYAKGTTTLTTGSLTMSGGDLTSTSGAVVVTGVVNISSAVSAIDFGSETWTVSGTWTNASTDVAWDAGTGTVTFDSATGGTMTFAGANLAEDEFSSVTFTSSAGTAQTFTMATRGLRLGGTLTVSDGVSTTTLDTAGLAITAGPVTVGAGGILTVNASTVTIGGTFNFSAGTFNRGTSVVVFSATGSLTTNGGTAFELYDVTINTTVILTFTTQVWVENALTINGTGALVSSGGDAQRVFFVSGVVDLSPVNITASADLDGSGYFVYRLRGACGSTYTISAAVYQHLNVQGGNAACAYTANLGGNISTPSCGVFNACAIIFNSEATGTPAANFVVNTGNFSITAGGTLWLGDGGTTGITFNAGAAAIEAFGIGLTGSNVQVNWQTATVIAHPSSVDDPIAYYHTAGADADAGTANLSIRGQLRLYAGATVFNANGATISVLISEGTASGLGNPGEVKVLDGTVIQFGTSTWTVQGLWQNLNDGAESAWDAGTATVTFDWRQTLANNFNFGGTVLGENEFFNVIFDSGLTTSASIVFDTDALLWGGTLTIRDTVGGSTTSVNPQGLALTGGALVVGNSGTLTANASAVTVSSVTMTGGTSGVITVTTGAWTVSGNWNTSGASSTYTQGTGIVTFSATATVTMLSTDNTFDDLTISGGTVTLASAIVVTNIITVSGGSFDTATLNITTGQIILNSPGTMSLSGDVLGFTRFEMNANYTHDGVTVNVTFTLTVNVGTMDLTQTTSGSASEVTWTLNPSNAGAIFTAIMGGLTANTSYDMFRDDILVQTVTTDASGNATFSVTGGWSPHTVSVQPSPGGGGGGVGGDVPGGRPPARILPQWIILMVVGVMLAAFVMLGSRTRRNRKLARQRRRR